MRLAIENVIIFPCPLQNGFKKKFKWLFCHDINQSFHAYFILNWNLIALQFSQWITDWGKKPKKNLYTTYGAVYFLRGFNWIGLVWVNKEGQTGFSRGCQGCTKGTRGAALTAQGKLCPSRLFHSCLHSTFNNFF